MVVRIVLVGAGEVGYSVAKTLSEDGHNIIVIEEDKVKADRVDADLNVQVINGNGASPSVLAKAGVVQGCEDIPLLIACTNKDEINIMACWIARRCGIPHVIGRSVGMDYSDSEAWSKQLGIDSMISPERSVAKEIEDLLEVRGAIRASELEGGKAGLYLFRVSKDSKACGITLAELRKQNPELNTIIICIRRGDESFVPKAHDMLEADDLCYTISYRKQVGAIEDIFRIDHSKKLRSAFIFGAGKLGLQIAKRIHSRWPKLAIKIFDPSLEKCGKIAEEIPEALVINSEGSDPNLLKAEGLLNGCAVISATGSDESNLMLSAFAKVNGALKSIAIVQKKTYLDMVKHIPTDAIVNRNQTLATSIIQNVRYPGVSRMLMLLDEIDAEAIAVEIEKNSPTADKMLSELHLPAGAVVGMISRKREIMIPKGDTRILAGDKVYLFASSEDMPEAIQHFGVDIN